MGVIFMTERIDPGRDQTNDIGKESADPYASDAHWISNGQQDRDTDKDIKAMKDLEGKDDEADQRA